MLPTGHVFIATGLDGFIARPDGSLDWLMAPDHAGEDHGYDAFLREGLIADVIISRIPVLIGAGRSLFGATGRDIGFAHIKTATFPSGLVQSVYAVKA